MFRRKEEGLFDNTDPTQEESANVASSQAGGASSPTYGQPPIPPGQQAASSSAASNPAGRGIPEARPAAAGGVGAPSANSFRPSANPISSDLTRNRMPEAKSPISAPQTNVSTGPTTTSGTANKSGRRVLTVGSDILLKGEIATCDRLVIEGKVDATLNDVHTVEIAETGSFKGNAHIEDAEISGLFEGELIVRNRLVIYASGKVRGKITYGEIEIERGGELSGEIKSTSAASGNQGQSSARARKDDKVAA